MPDASSAAERDQRDESAVLRVLLHESPEQLTVEELRRQLVGPDPTFSSEDSVNRAVSALERAGLVHRQGILIWASRAARYYYTLDIE